MLIFRGVGVFFKQIWEERLHPFNKTKQEITPKNWVGLSLMFWTVSAWQWRSWIYNLNLNRDDWNILESGSSSCFPQGGVPTFCGRNAGNKNPILPGEEVTSQISQAYPEEWRVPVSLGNFALSSHVTLKIFFSLPPGCRSCRFIDSSWHGKQNCRVIKIPSQSTTNNLKPGQICNRLEKIAC